MEAGAQVHTWVPAHDAAQGHAWVPIREAAAALGVSADTIKRRIKAGDLPARKDPRPQGFVWLVQMESARVPAAVAAIHAVVPAPVHAPAPEADAALAVALAQVDELRAQVKILSDELDARRREVHDLLALLQRSAAPQQHEGSAGVPAPVVAPVPPMHARVRPPWWRRFLQVLADSL